MDYLYRKEGINLIRVIKIFLTSSTLIMPRLLGYISKRIDELQGFPSLCSISPIECLLPLAV